MIDTTKNTPITAEWLESVGFCKINGIQWEKRFGSIVVVQEGRHTRIFDKVFDCDEIDPEGSLSQERLSALWFGMTGEELT